MSRLRPDHTSPRAALVVAFVALFVDMLIYGIAVPVLPLFPAVASGGDATTGLLFAVYAGGLIAVTPLAGRWIDRSGPRGPSSPDSSAWRRPRSSSPQWRLCRC